MQIRVHFQGWSEEYFCISKIKFLTSYHPEAVWVSLFFPLFLINSFHIFHLVFVWSGQAHLQFPKYFIWWVLPLWVMVPKSPLISNLNHCPSYQCFHLISYLKGCHPPGPVLIICLAGFTLDGCWDGELPLLCANFRLVDLGWHKSNGDLGQSLIIYFYS